MDTLEQFEKLKKYDTPTITNVVATYPGKEYCMGLYDPCLLYTSCFPLV